MMIGAPGETVRRCVGLLRREPVLFALALACTLILSLLQLPGPLLSMRIIDSVNLRVASPFDITIVCGALLLTVGISTGLRVVQITVVEILKVRMLISMQREALAHALRLPLSQHQLWPHSYVVSRVEQDPNEVQSALAGSVLRIIADVSTLTVTSIVLALLHWRLALLAAAGLPGIVIVFLKGRATLRRQHGRVQEQSAVLHGFLGEQLGAVFTIKSFGLEPQVLAGFTGRARRLGRERTVVARVKASYDALFGLVTSGVPVLLLWYGLHEISADRLTMGQFVAFNSLLMSLYRPTEDMIISLLSLQASVAALDRIHELIELPAESDPIASEPAAALHPPPAVAARRAPALECRDLAVRHDVDGRWIIEHVNLTCERGEMIGVCGPSGAGKTTLVTAIPRLIAITSGRILLDGVDHNRLPLAVLRRRVTLITPDSRLFSGTILDNIWCGDRSQPRSHVERAAEHALVTRFVDELPEGYETSLGESGVRLSAGQRQRVLLARSLMRAPEVLILDEATACLDVDNEREVLTNIRRALPHAGILVVSHRPDTWAVTDRVLTVKDARVQDWWAVPPGGAAEPCFEPLVDVPSIGLKSA